MIAIMLATALSAGKPTLTREADGLVYSQHRAFRIPVDLTEQERKEITGVRLFVSDDEGRSWSAQSTGPADTKFVTFQASKDGLYGFCIALVDASGKQHPETLEGIEPGLVIAVDSEKPKLMVRPIKTKSGSRGVKWEATDENIDPTSVRLAVRKSDTAAWEPLEIRHPETQMAWFDDNTDYRSIQAMVKDKASNVAIMQVDVFGDRFAKRDVDQFALTEGKEAVAIRTDKPMASDVNPPEPPTAAAAPEPVKSTKAPQAKPASALDGADVLATTAKPGIPAKIEPEVKQIAHVDTARPVEHQVMSPKAPNVQLSNSSRIAIDYNAEVGAQSQIVLWGSNDHGKTWQLLGVDDDRQSPIEVDLPRIGVWSLKMESGAEPHRTQPTVGAPADVVIEVDTVAPFIQLQALQAEGSVVNLKWSVIDKNLEAESVQLMMQAGQDPWKVVANNLERSGEHQWTAPTGAVGPVVFRLEAKDLAGNVGKSEAEYMPPAPAKPDRIKVIGIQPRAR